MLVTPTWLADHLRDPDLVVVDLRWDEQGRGRNRYEEGHIPGAHFLDWAFLIVPGGDGGGGQGNGGPVKVSARGSGSRLSSRAVESRTGASSSHMPTAGTPARSGSGGEARRTGTTIRCGSSTAVSKPG